ncbi:hypothetical protein MSG28_008259 [Choristoneura fumiferana]|uniref:Uncharacterized protein n=1 Tax=Choristoneura fumiferana TaxID=7141 RepID=A0ACC0JAP1_CHOFU|nr:hypothetical protein MSG28_008259 [Choristoneura fumiferana]
MWKKLCRFPSEQRVLVPIAETDKIMDSKASSSGAGAGTGVDSEGEEQEDPSSSLVYETADAMEDLTLRTNEVDDTLREPQQTDPLTEEEKSETEEVPRADGGEEEDEEWVEGEDLLARLQRIQARKGLLCEPDNPEKFSWLPYEVVLLILRWVVSAELDAATWGAECGLPYALGVPGWRAMFVARPRLLLHGCYISKTTYLRCGENSFQDQTYRPWFLVDYYRYLRSPVACVPQLKSRHRLAAGALRRTLPAARGPGMCTTPDEPVACVPQLKSRHRLAAARSPDTTGCKGPGMCTTPDEPVACVPQLKSRHRLAAGALAGHYRLQGDQVLIIVKKSNEKKPAQPTHTRFRSRRKETHESHETIFRLELQIRAVRGRGNWQLAWRGYSVSTRRDQWTQFELSPAK